MEIKKDIMWRIYLVFMIFCLFGLAIVFQIFRIQFVQGDYWRSKADSLTTQIKVIDAARGNIFSCDGDLLATSVPIYDLRLDTKAEGLTDEAFRDNIDSLALCLSTLFNDQPKAEYKHELQAAKNERQRYYLVHRNVSYAQLQKVKKFPLFRLGRHKGGLIIEQKNTRELPFKKLAARTIGYQRTVKPVGIEAAYNNDLEGVTGRRLMQRIAGGVWMPLNDKEEVEPRDGNDLVTTIDVNIQDVAESALEQHLIKNNADRGCVAVMEVATGEIKAIANLTKTASGYYSEEFNYVIAEATEPGSTMKMLSLLAAMDDGLVEPTDMVAVGNGHYMFFGQSMKDSHAPHKSTLSVTEAFMTSSNVGISRVIYNAYAKHPQDFVNKLHSFGLDKQLGLQIEGEGNPRIKNTTDKDWSSVSLPWMSIGYEVKLTPLQILTFYNAIANNGRMVKPKFVNKVLNHGQVVESYPTEIVRDTIASSSSIEKARRLLEAVVDSGTASVLKNSNYTVAGKTGTAQMYKGGYKGGQMTYQASFVGYFPAEAPKYSAIVVVYAPSSGVYYGGAVAAPVFREVADKIYANRMDLHKPLQMPDSILIASPRTKQGGDNEVATVYSHLKIPAVANDRTRREFKMGLVPNVLGMGARDALYLLENSGLNVQLSGRGSVTKQSLSPGTKIQKGQQIVIELG